MGLVLPASLWPVLCRSATEAAWPPPTDRASDLFVEQAWREGLFPLLCEEEGLPAVVLAALDRHRAWRPLAARRAEILLQAVDTLGAILGRDAFALLKGADYMRRLYPRPELRPMQDIDLLVPRDRVETVCRRLREAGLQPRAPRKAEALVSFYYERAFTLGDVIVEVHHGFVQRIRHRIDYEGVWIRRVVDADGRGLARLCDVDALAGHAVAMAKDEFSVPLIRYVDFCLMVEGNPELLRKGMERAREWGTVRAFYGMLRQASRLFPELATPEREALASESLARPVRAFLDRFVLPDPRDQGKPGVVTRTRQIWRKLWLIDSLGRRLGFGLCHLYAIAAGRFLAMRGPRTTEKAS